MIKLDCDLNFSVETIEYPMKIINENVCLHCGAQGTLKTVNVFGKSDPSGIRPFSHIKCENCKRIFSIQWTKIEDGRTIPVAISPSVKNEFLNMLGDKSERENTLV